MNWIYDRINNYYVPKFKNSGKLPIGNLKLYDYVTDIYLSFVDKGVDPQSALDLTNLVIAEGGWYNYGSGDFKLFLNVDDLTNHVIQHHKAMYPDTLKSTNWESFYRGLNVTPKYKYNSKDPNYKKWLYQTRPGIKKRINFYRLTLNLTPLAYLDSEINNIV